ncbi:MAG TPA: CHASE3 domain-containing protein [Candidatus Angelobacter sp.]|nr:CHASE3 domain-containing protein [Candidatus Angelobacter sp.]
MRLIYKRFSVIGGFAILLAVLVINTAVTRRQIAVQDNNQAWVLHTQQVMLELSTVESLLKDAETGQRGYLYTGEPKYLEPYNSAIQQVDTHIASLAELLADNHDQVSRVVTLRNLSKAKLDELAHTIALYGENQKDQARAVVLSDAGKRDMDNIRALMGEMQRHESALETARLESVHRSTRSLVRTTYLATVFAVIGLVLLALYILREMDQREKHAAEIREREEWFRVTLGSIGDAVIATDRQGKVTFVNPIAEDLTGIKLSNARGQVIQKVFPIFNEQSRKPVENPVAKVLEHGRIMGLANHTVLQRSDGVLIPIEDSAAPIYDDNKQLRGVVMVFRDVTLEKQAQDVMRKAEKLAAAGRLAATVAHEINNPLEAVCNLIYIVQRTDGLPDDIKSYLTMAEQELDRVSHITRQTLGFYRDSSGPVPVKMAEVVRSVLRIYENKLKSKNITVELDIADCAPVQGLQGELKQLVANLISNAADAVATGGRIKITVRPEEQQQSKGVAVIVTDNGPGVAVEHRAQIFEPFFTTKEDVGTGLGLWVSKEIAERHGGSIRLGTGDENGFSGAAFKVFLPVEPQTEHAA